MLLLVAQLLENMQQLRDERAAASQLLAATGRVPETLWKRLRALPLSQQCFVFCAIVEAAECDSARKAL